jgi:hypothetical protein
MVKNCKFKCDDFETGSLTEMVGYILSQCDAEGIIATWYYLTPTMPCLVAEINNEDKILGSFRLGDLLLMHQNHVLSEEIYNTAYAFVDNYLIDELHRAYNRHEEMIITSVGINDFHINLIWED